MYYTKRSNEETNQEGMPRKFGFLPILDYYILSEFMIPFSVLLFTFCLLFLIGDVFNDLSDFLEYKAPFETMAKYFIYKMPGNIRFILPISVLLACMYTLANFGRHREITAMRASGISLRRCGGMMYVVGFIVMLFNFWFNEQLVPVTEVETDMIMGKLRNKDYEKRMYSMLQFRSSDKKRDWLFQSFDKDGVQTDVILKSYLENNTVPGGKVLDWDIRAKEARYIEGDGWVFKGVTRTPYNKQFFLPGSPEILDELKIPASVITEKPADIVNAVKAPEELPTWVIYQMLRDNDKMVPALRNIYETLFYYRIAFPWVCLLCVFLALPLAAKNERSGIFTAIVTAVVVIVVYQVLTEIFMVLGKQGIVPPIIGGLAPTVGFIIYGYFGVVRKSG